MSCTCHQLLQLYSEEGFKVIRCNVQLHTSEFGGCGPVFLVLSMLQESSSKVKLRVKVECS